MTAEARLAIAQSRLALLGEPQHGESEERAAKRARCLEQVREAQAEIALRARHADVPSLPPLPYKDDD